jgi:hypothetical protein
MTRHPTAVVLAVALTAAALSTESPAFAQKLLSDDIRELSDQIVASAGEQQKHGIAVLAFRELRNGEQTVLASLLRGEK